MIIAQMIGKNEEGRFLKQVLDRLSKQVDLIVFTDDCSDDNTMDIATSYGAATFRTPRPMFSENEGALRQLAWDNMSKFAKHDDWILAIDCDEEFYPTKSFDKWIEQKQYPVLGITFFHMWNETHYRADKAWRPTLSSRMFRYRENGQFKQRALACGSEPIYVESWVRRRMFAAGTGFAMKHLGYAYDEDKQLKYSRYVDLDNGKFHSSRHIESIMDENPTLVEWNEVVENA